jgi:hypothetical protein
VNFDSFMRLNVRLDLIMDEIEVAKEGAGLIDKSAGELGVREGRGLEVGVVLREGGGEGGGKGLGEGG